MTDKEHFINEFRLLLKRLRWVIVDVEGLEGDWEKANDLRKLYYDIARITGEPND